MVVVEELKEPKSDEKEEYGGKYRDLNNNSNHYGLRISKIKPLLGSSTRGVVDIP